jgi:hypothetical protein
MPSDPQPSTPPQGVTFGDPVQAGTTFGTPSTPPQGVTFGDPSSPSNPYDKDTIMGNIRASGEEAKGFVKGAGRTAAGLLDLYSKAPGGVLPGVSPEAQRGTRAVADWLHQHTQLNNEYQKTGNVAETVAEFAGPLLAEKLGLTAATGAAEGMEAAPGVVQKVSDALGAMAKKAKIFEENPDIHAMVQRGIEAVKSTAPGRVIASTLSGVTEGAARGAAEQGAQTYVKTGGDPEATLESAKTGAIYGGVGGGVFSGGARTVREGAQAVENARPITLNLGGGDFPALAGGKKLNMPPLDEVQVDPITSAVDQATGNIGKTAVANSLARSLMERPAGMQRETQFDRLLPAPEGSAQGFRVGTAPAREVGQPPRTSTVTEKTGTRTAPNPDYEAPAGVRPPGRTAEETAEEIGQGATTATPERSYEGPPDTRNATQRRLDAAGRTVPRRMIVPPETVEQPVYQQRPVTTQPTKAVTTLPDRATEMQPDAQGTGGGGPMILTSDGQASSVERARLELARRERILSNPDLVDEMGTRQHQAMMDEHADLSEQLRRYDDYAARQAHFPVPNIPEAINNTTSIGEAGDFLKAHHGAFWDAADKASGGQFSALRDEEKWLEKKLYSENPSGKLEDLRQQLAENQQKQMDFFDQHRTAVSPQEWDTARQGYQDGIVLKNLHNLIESNFKGITRADVAARPSLQRVFTPQEDFTKQLNDFYEDGFRNTATNGQVLERTIGKEHMLDLKSMGQLFENSERREATKSLMDNISANVRRHGWAVGGIGGAAGYGLAHAAGTLTGVGAEAVLPTVAGMVGVPLMKGTVTGTMHYLSDRIASDPDFMKRFTYAVLNKIPPRTAGPILASRIVSTPAATIANQENRKEQ